MGKYIVEGSKKLFGEVKIHGAKNSALPILAGALLCDNCIVENCPELSDIHAAINILEYLGCETIWDTNSLIIKSTQIINSDIPENLMSEMRSSIVFLGAIVSKAKKARFSLPGGCELGPRPIDLHISSLEKMGVTFEEDHGYLNCFVKDKLHGAKISLPIPSVGATENIILAGCMAEGETVIYNAAREPEIGDLAGFLNTCGANITISDNGTVYIYGVNHLCGGSYKVMSDRIAAATYLCCGAAAGGEIIVSHINPEYLLSVLPPLEEMGCQIKIYSDRISLTADKKLKAVRNIRTMPYPGFPTDAQAPIMAVSTIADGSSMFVETIFQNRYKHAEQMQRMGADIKIDGRIAIVQGVKKLHSATVKCTDLRGGAAMVICALAAEGISTITEISHILRGYESIEKNLQGLGASIYLEN
ncbi:MAG: UDP-N-acetylglucosamine 1-carboxyvinyltransferase [Oscillospiraceae bacterium]